MSIDTTSLDTERCAAVLPAPRSPRERRYEAKRLALPVVVLPTRTGRMMFHLAALLLSLLALPLLRRRRTPGSHGLPAGPVIVVGNHRSVLDGPLLALEAWRSGRQLRMMGTAGVFTAPVVGRLLLSMGMVPVKRRSTEAASALEGARQLLDAGEAVGLFPEGRIVACEGGALGELRPGAARLALETRTPVVCAGLWDTSASIAPGSWKPVRFWRTPVASFLAAPLDLAALVGLSVGEEVTRAHVEAATATLAEALDAALAAAGR